MTIGEQESEGYITLKEASERFGYAPDYVGQLIRKGKIEGKQVYANVAWMTTVKAMEAYVAGSSGQKTEESGKFRPSLEGVISAVIAGSARKWFAGSIVVLALLASFVFVFILASVISDRTHNESEARKNAAAEEVSRFVEHSSRTPENL